MDFQNTIKFRLSFITQRDKMPLAKVHMIPMIFCFNKLLNVFFNKNKIIIKKCNIYFPFT